jgi:outer membrane protein
MIRIIRFIIFFALAACSASALFADNLSVSIGTGSPLSLSNLVQLVLERNEALQAKFLDFEFNRQKYLAEQGAFEPDAVGSVSREVNNRPNNAEQASTDNTSILHETNNIYDAGLESLIPSGARLHLGYTLSDLNNNITPFTLTSNQNLGDLRYQSFFGLTVTQPLLKNFGTAVTMAGIRLAALSSKIAFQEYRRQLMTVVSTAEATYWNLYLSQQQVKFFEESVVSAEKILKDNHTRYDAGKGSELEIYEAEAELGLRRAKLEEARQKSVEAVNHVLSMYAERASNANTPLRAVDVPVMHLRAEEYQKFGPTAFELNPDYIIQSEKLDQEMIRLGYAKNQRLPQLDLKGSYGMNGLGGTPEDSYGEIQRNDYTSWSVGLEFRIPLGATKVRHEYTAAQMEVKSAELSLEALQTEIFNGLDSARHKVESLRSTVDSYQSSVKYNQSLLDSALTRLSAGKLESRKVFDIEADLFEAKNAVVESLVRYQVALLEMEVVEGDL